MKNGRLYFVLLIVLLTAGSLFADESGLSVKMSVSPLKAGISFGAEYRFNENIGCSFEAGPTLFSFEEPMTLALIDSLSFIYYLPNFGEKYSSRIHLGIPTGILVFTDPFSTLSTIGISYEGGFVMNNGFILGFRAGSGFPVYTEGSRIDREKWSFFANTDLAFVVSYSL